MYHKVKSKVKFNNHLIEELECAAGVRLSVKILFAIYINDIEEELILKGADGLDANVLSSFSCFTLTA